MRGIRVFQKTPGTALMLALSLLFAAAFGLKRFYHFQHKKYFNLMQKVFLNDFHS